ncbi:MAG: Co2+/Mg2+ efflux protein ApaG [Bacteroidia bacterium]|nr:Co2+/Mg2+ efflux protein ApaG [Bacteroidia bacterium]
MVTSVTKGIRIVVRTQYQDLYSKPDQGHFLFTYRITIENNSEYTVKLLRRHWFIFDSSSERREVEGDGVVGQQPVLMPGDIYEYESASNLTTELGKMSGYYIMERQADKLQFRVEIPEFELVVPAKLN